MTDKPTSDDSASTREPDQRNTGTWYTGDAAAGPFADLDDFQSRGLRLCNVDLQGYLHHKNLIVWLDASVPDYDRPTPETFINAIAKLPQPDLLYKVIVVNHGHPFQAWFDQTGVGKVASETRRGDVYLYRPTGMHLHATLAYEWALQFLDSHEEIQKRFQMALDIERLPMPDPTGRDDPKLKWARFIEWFLPADVWPLDEKLLTYFLELIAAWPIHSAIFARALRASLVVVDTRYMSSHHAQHVERADFLAFAATQIALKRLKDRPSSTHGNLVEWLEAPVSSWLLEWPVD